MLIALTREVSPAIIDCELTHVGREPIDVSRAAEQHARYEEILRALGCTIQRLPSLPDFPDAVFVEDTAVVLPEVAIVTRPGAESRRPEVESTADALRAYRPLGFIEGPGSLDGGDVLVIGRDIYVGRSGRSNEEGISQLADLTARHGYRVRPLEITGCLHLKSAVTRLGEDVVLINPEWVDETVFETMNRIHVHSAEPFSANALLVGKTVIVAAGFNRTQERLERAGIEVRTVETGELQKAEGGVTCCSILVETGAVPGAE